MTIVNNSYELNFFSRANKIYRVAWSIFYIIFFKYTPPQLFSYRNFVLKIWGSKIQSGVRIYPTVKIWSPRNLVMKKGSSIGPRAYIYNQGNVEIGEYSIISQDVTICASTHNYKRYDHPLVLKNITIGKRVWVCAESFIGPGVTLNDGCILGARGVAKKNLDAWYVYDGNPCQKIKKRVMENE
ncbi:acetyltransferase [Escherichia coli]|nr:hypothetical protein AE25_02138 [Escherichia coli UCI 66]UMB36825.1 acetyltransferase [Escherichia coli]CAD5441806.1 hypothetical protein QREC_QR418_00576 [Escherichia coli]CAD5469314.1 hypothetical protein QREC_QR620_03089 [Escherichia coli]CAK0690334.1 acetyltransferase [Escherichia coli]